MESEQLTAVVQDTTCNDENGLYGAAGHAGRTTQMRGANAELSPGENVT